MWFAIAVIFTIVMMVVTRRQWNPSGEILIIPVLTKNLARFFLVGIFAAFILTFLTDTVVIVPAGQRGVVFDRLRGGVQEKNLNEGLNFVIPFVQEATLFDVRIQKVEFDATAASKDLQFVRTKVALNYNPIATEVQDIYKQYGLSYAEKVVHPAVQEAVKSATARYTAEELITKREEVKDQIQDILSKHVARAHLKLVETYITDFEFSPEFARAIEAKQIAEQDALKARRDLDRVKIEAEQKIAQSRAEAEGLRMQKEAITPQLIELRKIDAQRLAIEKWDGHMPNVMMGGATPFIDVNGMIKDKR